jgi:hypothetical protein
MLAMMSSMAALRWSLFYFPNTVPCYNFIMIGLFPIKVIKKHFAASKIVQPGKLHDDRKLPTYAAGGSHHPF